MYVPRHDAHLAGPGRDDAGAVRADQSGIRVSRERGLHFQHVEYGYALGDACDDTHSGPRCFENRICRERGRHVDHRRIRACLAYRVMHGVEHRSPEVFGPASPGGDTPDEIRPVGDCLLGVERPLPAPVNPWQMTRVFSSTSMLMVSGAQDERSG